MPPTPWTEANPKPDGNYADKDYVDVDYWEDLDEEEAAPVTTTWTPENPL